MVAHEDYHQVLLVIIYKVAISQEDSTSGADLKLLWQVLLDIFG
jgi:hypothetical protein